MNQKGKTKFVKFELGTKILLLILVNVLLFLSKKIEFECLLTGTSLILVALNGQWKSSLRFCLCFLIMVIFEYGAMPHLDGFVASLILFISVAVRKILPCLIIGKWIITTTKVSEFVATMWKLRLPQEVIIPLSVGFRYFPTLKEQWQSIRMAMKMRGIGLSVEHVLVPLMMSAVTISEELSAAALCRGLDRPNGHTYMGHLGFGLPDYIALGFYGIMAVGVIWLKAGGKL